MPAQFSREAVALGDLRHPQTPALVLRAPDRAKGHSSPLDQAWLSAFLLELIGSLPNMHALILSGFR